MKELKHPKTDYPKVADLPADPKKLLKLTLQAIGDLYYRHCCWDDEWPCEDCQEFDLIKHKALAKLKERKKK